MDTKVVTFYSYKGGVGRTLTACNFSVYLAKLGLKVVIADFDLDAPGVDSKFPDFEMPNGQTGILDMVVEFQKDGAPLNSIAAYTCSVPIKSAHRECEVILMPAGDYLSKNYATKLNELNWSLVFSKERDGVAFFQQFLAKINQDLGPDVLVIDSRTGFSELGGLCTQQLADETVILTSMAAESLKMTRHLAKVIRNSPIAKKLNKSVETKIVVSRIPPARDIEKLKARMLERFDVEERNLFFLFSCPELEREEFVAMIDTEKEDRLVSSYIQLFQGLDVKAAQRSIDDEIERAERGLLSKTPIESERQIRELVALFPHPDVYRRAMRFFDLRSRPEEAAYFGIKLLDLIHQDEEAHVHVAKFFLRGEFNLKHGAYGRTHRKLLEVADVDRLVDVTLKAYRNGDLDVREKIRLADILEDLDRDLESFDVASKAIDENDFPDRTHKDRALGIAARTALATDNRAAAEQLIKAIPPSKLSGDVALVAIKLRAESGGKEEAFELAKFAISNGMHPRLISEAFELARELRKESELMECLKAGAEEHGIPPEVHFELQRRGFDVEELIKEIRPRIRRREARYIDLGE